MSGGESSNTDVTSTAKETLDTVIDTISNNKLLIGGIAAGCGAAIFLLATDSGKRVRSEIQNRAEDVYDVVSEQLTSRWEQLNSLVQNVISGTEKAGEEATSNV